MTELRELLFGDVPIEDWAGTSNEPPWTHFRDATPEGLHFTEGAFTQLAEDQPTAAVFAAGTALMSALIDRARSREPYPQNASGGHRDPRKSADLRGRHPRMSAARTPKGRPSLRECRSRALSRRLLPSPCC